MRRKGLWLRASLLGCLVLAPIACKTSPPPEEPATASRAEVTLALYRQLHLVLERHDELGTKETDLARDEQDELVRLAAEIAVRIVRVDPEADVDGLVFRMLNSR